VNIAHDASLGLAMKFKVKVMSYDLGSWQKAAGLDVAWDPVEYRAGDAPDYRWFVQGIAKYKNVTLSRVVNKDDFLKVKSWLESGDWSGTEQVGYVTLLDTGGHIVCSWDLRNVMPTHWSVDGFDATQSKMAIETLELAHMGFLEETRPE
jgi:phage tail-like protein